MSSKRTSRSPRRPAYDPSDLDRRLAVLVRATERMLGYAQTRMYLSPYTLGRDASLVEVEEAEKAVDRLRAVIAKRALS